MEIKGIRNGLLFVAPFWAAVFIVFKLIMQKEQIVAPKQQSLFILLNRGVTLHVIEKVDLASLKNNLTINK